MFLFVNFFQQGWRSEVALPGVADYLVEDNRHDEEVQQETLGGVRTVEVEKNEREEKREELEAGVAEGGAQEFQPGDRRQEDVAAAKAATDKRSQASRVDEGRASLFSSAHWIPSFLLWLRAKPSLVRALSTIAG